MGKLTAFGCTVVSTMTGVKSAGLAAPLRVAMQALLQQSAQFLFLQALAPAADRGAVKRQLVTEERFAAEPLVIQVLQPALA